MFGENLRIRQTSLMISAGIFKKKVPPVGRDKGH